MFYVLIQYEDGISVDGYETKDKLLNALNKGDYNDPKELVFRNSLDIYEGCVRGSEDYDMVVFEGNIIMPKRTDGKWEFPDYGN